MRIPIGSLLVRQGVITQDQCEQILERQRLTHRPFGEIAEDMFGVQARAIESAWAVQYAETTQWVDPTLERIDPAVRDIINRRQAWQFRMLPIRYDGNELMVCTTQTGLIKAMNFAMRQIPVQCYFVLSDAESLGNALMRHYSMEGMTPAMVA